MTISFESIQREATFNDPRQDFDTVSIDVEHRFDPLTNRTSRLVSSAVPPVDKPLDIESYVTDDSNCVFCPDMVSSVTPEFVDNHSEKHDGRGQALCFPNITPYAEESLVVVLTEDHHRAINELTSELLTDGLLTAWNTLEDVDPGQREESFKSINMNFYPSSGSSIVHPHLHGIADDVGATEYRRLLQRSRVFRDDHGHSYWRKLVEIERESGDRYISREGCTDWLAAFAPKHFDHVFGIVDPTDRTTDEAMFEDLGNGIINVLDHYHESDFNSFNFSLFLPGEAREMPPILQIVARTPFNKYYSSGAFFKQILHDEGIFEVAPETYSNEIAGYF